MVFDSILTVCMIVFFVMYVDMNHKIAECNNKTLGKKIDFNNTENVSIDDVADLCEFAKVVCDVNQK